MQQSHSEETATPFFEILSEADEIRVRELKPDVEKSLSLYPQMPGLGPNRRAFVVYVTVPTPKMKQLSDAAKPTELPRTYLIDSANLLLKSKDYLLGRNIFSLLLKRNIRDRDALRGLGICFYRLGDIVAAQKCFRAFYELFHEEEGLFWLGMAESVRGNLAAAAGYFGQIKQPEFLPGNLHGTSPAKPSEGMHFEYLKEFGNSLTKLGEFKRAEEYFKRAMQLDPSSDAIFVNLGTLCTQDYRYEAAHTHFVKAISLNPKNARAYCGLGMASLELGQGVFAEKQFIRALEIDPQNGVALSQLMKLADTEPKILALRDKAERFLERDKKNSAIRFLHAVCEFKLGRYQCCQGEIERLLRDDPSHEAAARLREELSKNIQGGIR